MFQRLLLFTGVLVTALLPTTAWADVAFKFATDATNYTIQAGQSATVFLVLHHGASLGTETEQNRARIRSHQAVTSAPCAPLFRRTDPFMAAKEKAVF